MVERLTGCMTKYFGFSSFRTGQKEAASSALHGRDVFVRMATGGGKSLSMFLVSLDPEQLTTRGSRSCSTPEMGLLANTLCLLSPQPLPLKH